MNERFIPSNGVVKRRWSVVTATLHPIFQSSWQLLPIIFDELNKENYEFENMKIIQIVKIELIN